MSSLTLLTLLTLVSWALVSATTSCKLMLASLYSRCYLPVKQQKPLSAHPSRKSPGVVQMVRPL